MDLGQLGNEQGLNIDLRSLLLFRSLDEEWVITFSLFVEADFVLVTGKKISNDNLLSIRGERAQNLIVEEFLLGFQFERNNKTFWCPHFG